VAGSASKSRVPEYTAKAGFHDTSAQVVQIRSEEDCMFRQKANMVLVVSILAISTTAFAAPPVATSYKATANITSLGPGTHECSDDRIPVSVPGNEVDFDGPYILTKQLCVNPVNPLAVVFSGHFEIRHPGEGSYSGLFNDTFFPSGQVLEVHATWRITKSDGVFANIIGAGTAKGVATMAHGQAGPGTIVLDGSTQTEDSANDQ
jgi:hypothetical protein